MNINSKFRLNNKQQIYILLFQTAYYLLKTDVHFTLQTFSEINSINSHIRVTDLEDISKELQNVHFSENINKIILPKPKSRTEKIVFVLKRTVEFLKLDQEDSIFKLTLLNSELKKSLTLKILKKILMKQDLIKKHRLHIWFRISTIKTISNQKNMSQIIGSNSMEKNPEKLIHLDCRRTSFCSEYELQLE